MVPIHQRIVKADAQAFRARRINVFAHQIPARPLFRSAIVSQLRIKITEAFVVLSRHYHVLHAGALCQLRPGTSSVGNRLKIRREPLVLTDWYAFVFHHPFVTPKRTVQTPVNEHAKPGFVPPLHPTFTVLNR